MTLSLPGERSIAAASPAHPFAAFMRWLANAQAVRARRTALTALLELEHVRLDDLGIRREDVIAAIRDKTTGQALNAVRARRAKL